MSNKIQVRRGTSAQGNACVLDVGEFGYDTDTKMIRIGDGVTAGGTKIDVGLIKTLWELPWVQGVIITNPADNYSLSSFPLARNGTMKTMDFYVTGTVDSATVITVKQGNNIIGTVSISVAGKTTLTFTTAVNGTLDDLFSWTFTGAGLSVCTVVANGKWVNR